MENSQQTEGHPEYPFIDVVFDRSPGPEAPQFVEVEDHEGKSIGPNKLVRIGNYGIYSPQWVERDDGYWALRFEGHTFFFAEEDDE